MLDHSLIKSTFVHASSIDVIYAALLSFVMGVAIAITYTQTFRGLTYSRGFLQSLIFAPLLTAIAMQAIGDSIARGLGLMGAFSLLRFRTNIKDTRDMMFIFAALAGGLASGVYAYQFAVISIGFFCLAVFIVHNVPFSPESDYDAVLKLQLDNKPQLQEQINVILKNKAKRFVLLSMREMAQGDRLDISYQLKLKKHHSQSEIFTDLGKIESLKNVQIFMQDQAHEV